MFSSLSCKQSFGNNVTKVANSTIDNKYLKKSERISKYVFLLQGAAGNSRPK